MSDLQTRITAVTVYPDRARVTRSGTLELEAGRHRLEVALPAALNPDSVRAAARGTARARLLGVDVRSEFLAAHPVTDVRELEQRVEAIQDMLNYLEYRRTAAEHKRKSLDALLVQGEVFAKGLAFGKITAADLLTFFDAYGERAGAVGAQSAGIAFLKRQLEREKRQLERQLEELRGEEKYLRYVATVEVEVLQGGELTVSLTAVFSPAGWKPLYDFRLDEAGEGEEPTLEVGYMAQVVQRTGEDWEDVALSLSTARPALTETVPELEPWYVEPPMSYAEPPRAAKAMAMPGFMEETTAEEAPLPSPPLLEAEEVTATVQSTGAAVTYAVPERVTIPTGGEARKVTVARFNLKPQVDYVTAPRLAPAAYRRATAVNDSPYALLPGSVGVFVGEEFIGTTELELTAPGGELELYLGTDDRLKVERELVRRDVDRKFLRERRKLRYGYEVRLENFLPTVVHVTVQDQMPVPRHEEIKVRLESAEPRPREQTALNLLEWGFALEPGGRQTVRFEFTVEYPRDMTVTGLP